MKNKTLLIMAAGMGSRFGGLKQIEEIGPNKEFIIDYSIYDAIQSGFNKVVFVIKEENYEIFKNTIGRRIEKQIPVFYAFQKNDNIPTKAYRNINRTKPWGTAHAILSSKDFINENFVVINSDDIYGYDAFHKSSLFLDSIDEDAHTYSVIGYEIDNTLTENGAVKRGILKYKEDNTITDIIESSITKKQNQIIANPLNNKPSFIIQNNSLVSTNMFAFTKTIFPYLEKNLIKFLNQEKDNLDICEYQIPDVISKAIKEKYAKVLLITTNSKWMGVTYKEDKDKLVNMINEQIKEGIYPNKLF